MLNEADDDPVFARQPAPQPAPMPRRFDEGLLAQSLERPWHRSVERHASDASPLARAAALDLEDEDELVIEPLDESMIGKGAA